MTPQNPALTTNSLLLRASNQQTSSTEKVFDVDSGVANFSWTFPMISFPVVACLKASLMTSGCSFASCAKSLIAFLLKEISLLINLCRLSSPAMSAIVSISKRSASRRASAKTSSLPIVPGLTLYFSARFSAVFGWWSPTARS